MQVLAAAAAAADAAGLAHQLGEERGEVAAGGEEVAVAAVGAEDGVAGAEPAEKPDRDRLLADRGVRRPGEEPLRVELEELLLGAADDQHPPVELEVVQHRRLLGQGSRVDAALAAFGRLLRFTGKRPVPPCSPSPSPLAPLSPLGPRLHMSATATD